MTPLSATLITAGEPTLEQAVASVRPHVAEVCIVSTNPSASSRVRRLADRFAECTDCLFDDGAMRDFARARNRCLELATQAAVVWLDSDDVVTGGEHLPHVPLGEKTRVMCAYDYATDPATSDVVVRQWRERIVPNNGRFTWKRPVHEGLVARDGQSDDPREGNVRWVHRRPYRTGDTSASERNLRILRDYAEREGLDTWARYNLGVELANLGQREEAAEHLMAYVAESGRSDERALACMRLSQLLGGPGAIGNALHWTRRAIEFEPLFFDAHLALARLYLVRAMLGGRRADFEQAIECAWSAAQCPETIVPTNPADRAAVHEVEFHAFRAMGAPESASAALARCPESPRIALMRQRADGVPPHAGLDVVFVCLGVPEPWNPQSAAARGIGGSETAVIEVGRRLAAKGHRVRVYSDVGTEGLYDGVEYLEAIHLTELDEVDVLVAWRQCVALEAAPARAKVLWAHDVEVHRPSPWRLSMADRVVALTEWHARHLCEVHGKHGLRLDAMAIIGNGVDVERFAQTTPRLPRRAIYSSSYDRGLETLLDLWPHIAGDVPGAELHVYYGGAWLRALEPKLVERIEARATDQGVVLHDRVSQAELAREMLSAGAWLYPSYLAHAGREFHETFCIGVCEAQAAGLRVVTAPWGALGETAKTGTLVHGDPLTAEWRDQFVRASIRALSREEEPGERAAIAASVAGMTWDAVAEKWDGMLRALLADRSAAAQ